MDIFWIYTLLCNVIFRTETETNVQMIYELELSELLTGTETVMKNDVP